MCVAVRVRLQGVPMQDLAPSPTRRSDLAQWLIPLSPRSAVCRRRWSFRSLRVPRTAIAALTRNSRPGTRNCARTPRLSPFARLSAWASNRRCSIPARTRTRWRCPTRWQAMVAISARRMRECSNVQTLWAPYRRRGRDCSECRALCARERN